MEPHPKNADGDFYVDYGCCTACDVPFSEAPELFQYDDSNHCFVKRQPATPNEVTRMLSAVMCAELQCIRYRGNDPEMFDRFGAIGAPDVCDYPPPDGIPVAIRSHVAFRVSPSSAINPTPVSLIEEYKQCLIDNQPNWISYRFASTLLDGNSAKFAINWFEDRFNEVTVVVIDHAHCEFLVCHPNEQFPGMSNSINRWLASDNRFSDIRWYTRNAWNENGKWHKTLW